MLERFLSLLYDLIITYLILYALFYFMLFHFVLLYISMLDSHYQVGTGRVNIARDVAWACARKKSIKLDKSVNLPYNRHMDKQIYRDIEDKRIKNTYKILADKYGEPFDKFTIAQAIYNAARTPTITDALAVDNLRIHTNTLTKKQKKKLLPILFTFGQADLSNYIIGQLMTNVNSAQAMKVAAQLINRLNDNNNNKHNPIQAALNISLSTKKPKEEDPTKNNKNNPANKNKPVAKPLSLVQTKTTTERQANA